MPVTVSLPNQAGPVQLHTKATSDTHLFEKACDTEFRKSRGIIQGSYEYSTNYVRSADVFPSANGLVYAAHAAYSHHNHLTISPEDVWFAILSQLGFYINANAEALRHLFVAHEGKKKLEVVAEGSRHSVDFGALAVAMTSLIQANVVDPDLRAWAMPDFSTTTASDRVVAAVLMMGSLQKYFSYQFTLGCGLPSATLLGERRDWEALQRRLDKLDTLGPQAAAFATLLRPVLRHFVATFDAPESPAVQQFWSRIAHRTGGSGPYYLSGWITAFCFWDADGKPLHPGEPIAPVSREVFEGKRAGCELDGVLYHRVNTDDIPPGFASVPVTLVDNGATLAIRMLAGSVGIRAWSSGNMLAAYLHHNDSSIYKMADNGQMVPFQPPSVSLTREPGLDSIQSLSGWLMYRVDETEETKKDAAAKSDATAYVGDTL